MCFWSFIIIIIIILLQSYLLNSRQFVTLNYFKSGEFLSTTGVPQESNLGPLLFLLLVNNIGRVFDVPHLLYADVLKMFLEIKKY